MWMSPVVYVSGYRYYILFTDDYTRYSWIFPMRLKSEVFGHFSTFAMYVKTRFSLSIKQFQSNRGRNMITCNLNSFVLLMALYIVFLVLIHPNRMGLQSENIVILLIWVALSYTLLTCLIIYGSKHFV
jgi:hypothetical protein